MDSADSILKHFGFKIWLRAIRLMIDLSGLFGDNKDPAEETWARIHRDGFQGPFLEKGVELFLEDLYLFLGREKT